MRCFLFLGTNKGATLSVTNGRAFGYFSPRSTPSSGGFWYVVSQGPHAAFDIDQAFVPEPFDV